MTRNEKLANDIKNFLEKHDMIQDTRIYFNNKCFSSKLNRESEDWFYEYELIEDIVPSDYFEYANNKTVSMSFEGTLNHILNYGKNRKLEEKFNKIFEQHSCYYEFGDAWNLTVYFDKEEE